MRNPFALLLLVGLTVSTPLPASEPYMVADLRPGSGSPQSSSPVFIGRLGDGALFVTTPSQSASALWITDGTESGTIRLLAITNDKRVYPPVTGPIVDGGTMYFGAPDSTGWRLWKSDGTVAGTTALTAGGVAPLHPIARLGGRLVFRRDRNEIWVHDGNGARLLRTIDTSTSSAGSWTSAETWNGLAFVGNDVGLWRSDGTEAGTTKISAVAAYGLEATSRGLIFAGRTIESGFELWVSDGSEAGTHIVADLTPGAGSTLSTGVAIREFGTGAFFVSLSGEIGVSNGSASGTRVIRKGAPQSWLPTVTVFDGMVYFGFDDAAHGIDLWKSDGTDAGTQMVLDDSTPADPSTSTISSITAGATHIYYHFGDRLMRSDGTAAGTATVWSSIYASRFVTVGDRLFFSGSDSRLGSEPWTSDGSTAGTHMIANLGKEAPSSSSPSDLVSGGSLTFMFAASANGVGLWRSDGSAEGTRLLAEAKDKQSLGGLIGVLGDTLYFYQANRLWMVRPDDETPKLAKEFTSEEGKPSPITGGLVFAGRLLVYVSLQSGSSRYDVWIGDPGDPGDGGTPSLRLLTREKPVSSFATLGGQFYFLSGLQLCTTNGDEASTRVVARLPVTNAQASMFVAHDGGLLLSTTGPTLWRFSGAAGDVRELATGQSSAGAAATLPVQVGASLLYRVTDSLGKPNQLWALDGETSTLLKTFAPGYPSWQREMVTLGKGAVLIADDGIHGGELWYSDGTVNGTFLLRDINGSGPSDPSDLVEANGVVYFAAYEPGHGRELWRTDGTPAGTYLVAEIAMGETSASPSGLVRAGDRILFSAYTEEFGEELWAYPLTDVPTLDIIDGRALEGSGQLTMEVRLTAPPSDRTVTVDYRTVDGTARAGRDYQAAAGTLRFEPGTTSRQISVPLLSDETPDVTRAFRVLLENSTARLARSAGAGIIDDDDARVDLQLSLISSNAHPAVVVRNQGPSTASSVRLCWGSRGSSFDVDYACEGLIEIPQGGEVTRGVDAGPGVIVARVTQFERDTNPDNNRMSWLGQEWSDNALFVAPPNPRMGTTGSIFLQRYPTSGTGTVILQSSDPAIVSVPGSVQFGDGAYSATAAFTAIKSGEATITATLGTLNLKALVHVLAPGDAARTGVNVRFNMLGGLYFAANNRLEAFVRGATPDGVLPTGVVSFYEDARLLGRASVIDQGAVLRFRDPIPGDHTYNAVYEGDENFFATPAGSLMPGHVNIGSVQAVRAKRLEDPTRVLITFEGIPGYPPAGSLIVLDGGISKPHTGNLKPIDDRSSTTITMDISPTATTLEIRYSGDSTFFHSSRHQVPIYDDRRRPVRR